MDVHIGIDRRHAIVFGGTWLLAACGGGGGGTAMTTASSAPAAPAPAPSAAAAPAGLSPNIITWGDSLTPPFAANLQVLYADRVVAPEGLYGQTSTTIADAEAMDSDHRNWINVFWYGHNNDDDPATIKADIARSISHLAPGNNRFIVLDVVNKADREQKGTDAYATIVGLNAQLAALYPDNFIDIRGWLVAHYNANDPGEVEDHANDVVPRSLRYDEIHLRNEGSVLVAQRVKQFIDAKGW